MPDGAPGTRALTSGILSLASCPASPAQNPDRRQRGDHASGHKGESERLGAHLAAADLGGTGPGRVSGLVFCRVIGMYVIFFHAAPTVHRCWCPFWLYRPCGKERMGERGLSDVPIPGAIAADLVIACRG
jgi:hypothetical protein